MTHHGNNFTRPFKFRRPIFFGPVGNSGPSSGSIRNFFSIFFNRLEVSQVFFQSAARPIGHKKNGISVFSDSDGHKVPSKAGRNVYRKIQKSGFFDFLHTLRLGAADKTTFLYFFLRKNGALFSSSFFSKKPLFSMIFNTLRLGP